MNIEKFTTDPVQRDYMRFMRSTLPEHKLDMTFQINEIGHARNLQRLKNRYPDLSIHEIKMLYLEKIRDDHNRDYTDLETPTYFEIWVKEYYEGVDI